MLLRGLKEYCAQLREDPRSRPSIQIDAVVTVTDDGGSSGRLRREYSILPPGDIRNCMVALSPDEALLSRLFQYRFPGSRSGLGGHSFGNLFLAALTHITGDFPEAVRLSSNVLATRGRIFPSTAKNVTLKATLDNGRTVIGETKISRSPRRIRSVEMVPTAQPLPQVIRAIDEADLILLGPGSLYTSIIPNLLVQGVASAIAKSKATRVYIANLMTQPGETTGYSIADHVRAIYQHAGKNLFDSIVLNTGEAPAHLLRRYRKEKAAPVDPSLEELDALGVQHVAANVLQRGSVIRHDQRRLAKLILDHYVYETRS